MIHSYGIPGESQEARPDIDLPPPGPEWVRMTGDRPAPHFICQLNDGVGVWVEPIGPQTAPASCTRRQGLLALLEFGFKRSDIEAQIAAIADETEREEAQIEYEANVWERANPRLQQMWALLEGSPEQLDDLFRLAVTL